MIFLLPPTIPRRIPNIRFYLNQIMHEPVRVAPRRGYLTIVTFFVLAGDARPAAFHKVILLLPYFNPLVPPFHILEDHLRDPHNLNLNLIATLTRHRL